MFSNGQNVQAAELNDFSVTSVTTTGDVNVGEQLKFLSDTGTKGQVPKSQATSPTLWGGVLTEQTTTATGAQNNFELTGGASTYLRCTGAAPIFSGFTASGAGAPNAGDLVLIDFLGATSLKLTNEATSTAANQIICESAAGQIVGPKGRILCQYDGTSDRWRATVLDPGAPITPTFSAGDYTTDAGTWTVAAGDVGTLIYQQRGKTVWVAYTINTTSVGTTPGILRITIPGGFTATKTIYGSLFRLVDNNVAGNGFNRVNASGTVIEHLRNDGALFTNSADLTYVFGQITFEVD